MSGFLEIDRKALRLKTVKIAIGRKIFFSQYFLRIISYADFEKIFVDNMCYFNFLDHYQMDILCVGNHSELINQIPEIGLESKAI